MSYAASEDGECMPSDVEIQQMMVDKAHELFAVCDVEEKGFITRHDMQRLQAQLPLSPDQLEAVFDSLDDDGNGYLTLEEFTDGFGSFLGLKGSCDMQASRDADDAYAAPPAAEDHGNFTNMMDNLGANSLFEDEATIEALWCRLRRDDPETSSHFEEFLYKVSCEMRKSKVDFDTLEGALKSKSSAHDEEVRKLYEEMEYQIKQEKDKILSEEKAKERQLREAMERELLEKDRQLQEILGKHQQLEENMAHLNTIDAETKVENDRLAKEKESLEDTLMKSQENLEESRLYISQLRDQQKQEKKERAKAVLKLSDGIAVERETLVNQLDLLRSVNKQLRDDKDEAETRRVCDAGPGAASPHRKQELERQGSSLGKYFPPSRIPKLSSCAQSISEDVGGEGRDAVDDGIECDDDVYIDHDPLFIHHNISTYQTGSKTSSYSPSRKHNSTPQPGKAIPDKDFDFPDNISSCSSYIPDSPRVQPVGADQISRPTPPTATESPALQRIFKVVFVGDSGVGKSSFIHRFCHNHFERNFAATVGVDFQIKSLAMEGVTIVLQLWDTAGQERFRSITKQYFRKADGVVVMYDVTTETSFTNVRNWMTSVEEGTNDDTICVLLGNKTDLPNDRLKVVKSKDGSNLADEYGALFYETSACNGDNVSQAMDALVRVLKEKEDKEIEKSFRLEDTVDKKSCCGS